MDGPLTTAMRGKPGGPLTRAISAEEQMLQSMSPLDALKFSVELGNKQRVGPEQAAQNRQQNLRDLLSIIPGPGNIIAAEDAYSAGRDAVAAFGAGRYGKGALNAGLSALSGFGAVTGLPTSRMAGNAAKEASKTLNAITLMPHATVPKSGKYDNLVIQDDGKALGSLSGYVSPENPSTLEIFNIRSPGGPGSLGLSRMREIMQALQQYYPGIEQVSGYRVSGARQTPTEASLKIPRGAER